ncbi:MAG: EpsI family protein, partial [Betaproteobacteria bacterium]|nr:EpsI family protein [Betaproteobacteria bacterium]
PVAGRLTDWTPRFFRPSAQIHQAYGKKASRVALYVGYYRNQQEGTELISSYNTLVPSNDLMWRSITETARTLIVDREEIASIEARLRGRFSSLLVWRWYWVDGRYILNPYWAKLLQAKSTLLGRGDDGAVVIVYAPYDDRPQAAEQVLSDFVRAMLPAITRSLEHARRPQPLS